MPDVELGALYVVPITTDGKDRHVIVRRRATHEGGMWEFHDPVSDEVVGSCGVYWAKDHMPTLEEWLVRLNGGR